MAELRACAARLGKYKGQILKRAIPLEVLGGSGRQVVRRHESEAVAQTAGLSDGPMAFVARLLPSNGADEL